MAQNIHNAKRRPIFTNSIFAKFHTYSSFFKNCGLVTTQIDISGKTVIRRLKEHGLKQKDPAPVTT